MNRLLKTGEFLLQQAIIDAGDERSPIYAVTEKVLSGSPEHDQKTHTESAVRCMSNLMMMHNYFSHDAANRSLTQRLIEEVV